MTANAETLAQVPLLEHLPVELRRRVVGAGHERRVGRGEILFHEEEPADALWAVVDGQVKLVRYSPRGKELLLHLVHPGQSFAEAALFADGTYPATAEAVLPSRLWCLPRPALESLLASSPELGMAMLGSISRWTRRLAAKLELLTQRRVEERLAVYLLARADRRRLEAGDEVELVEPRHLIAAQCGTAPEVLSRTFRKLEEDRILVAETDRVRVLRPDKLRALAEWIGD